MRGARVYGCVCVCVSFKSDYCVSCVVEEINFKFVCLRCPVATEVKQTLLTIQESRVSLHSADF